MFAGFTHDAVVPIVHLYSLLSVLHMHECAPPIYVWCCFQIGALTNNIVMKHPCTQLSVYMCNVFMPRGGISGSDGYICVYF